MSRRVLVIALSLVAARGARADDGRGDDEFDRGKKLLGQGKIAEACAAFDESQRLDPTVPTLMNQADCRERNGQLATAWRLFREAARQGGASDASSSGKLRDVAAARAAKLEPRLSTLRVVVAKGHHVDGLVVRRDAEDLAPGTWNEPQPVDGGKYEITATAPGHESWSTTIEVGVSGDAQRVEVPLLAVVPRRQATTKIEYVDGGTWSTTRWIAVGVAGATLVDVGVSIALGVSAQHRREDAEATCVDPDLACPLADSANAALATARERAHAANVGYGLAAAGALASGILWLVGKPRAIAIEPPVTGQGASVSVVGSF